MADDSGSQECAESGGALSGSKRAPHQSGAKKRLPAAPGGGREPGGGTAAGALSKRDKAKRSSESKRRRRSVRRPTILGRVATELRRGVRELVGDTPSALDVVALGLGLVNAALRR